MARTLDSYGRKSPRFKQQPRILVVCEDKKSGLHYLKEAAKHYRVNVQVEILHVGHTDPKGIVAYGEKVKSGYDHVYFMIDRDDHQNYEEAITIARKADKLTTIVSNPCFEFWLYLHYKYSRKSYRAAGKKSAADLMLDDLKLIPEMQNYCKGNVHGLFNGLIGQPFNDANTRAKRLLAEASADGEYNPTTQVHLLLATFKDLSEPISLTQQIKD